MPQQTFLAAELISDTTILQPGMTLAGDEEIPIDDEPAGWIEDSIVVTETGCDYLTDYGRKILITAS